MKNILTSLFFILSVSIAWSQSASPKVMRKLIDENMNFAAAQYQLLEKNVQDTMMPKTFDSATNKVIVSNTKWWCSGFFPGTLWYLYEYTKNESIRKIAEKRLAILEREKFYTGNHDLGFMIFCSFGNAYRITQNPAYKEVIFQAAASLSTRYRPSIQSIQSWNANKKFRCPVIIDNMMNLELLHWVTDQGGESRFREIAENHTRSTIKNHFRPDHSSYHVVDYDLATGTMIGQKTAQGYSDASAWARGQSWGLYGFTAMYRFTKNPVYLEKAQHIARFMLDHPNLPADKIPYWDFDAPNIPQAKRDASAGAVMASALLELAQYVAAKDRQEYIQVAETILQNLSTPQYRAPQGGQGGFLLMHSVGHLPGNSEVDVPLTYADYYFIEALLRYKNWYLKK